MPTVSYNSQCFLIDSRRVFIVGASIDYARCPREQWRDRIAAARQAGFNTIDTAIPWALHEPRMDRFDFDGQSDIAEFLRLCGEEGMMVMLRPGPFVGSGYDGGGIPGWVLNLPDIAVREANPGFLERVSKWFFSLLSEVADLQVTNGGPIILVQCEHAWEASNDKQGDGYLREIVRMLREGGINVPITNANDLWQEVTGTIDTWRGYEDLLIHLRQFRTLKPESPRVVSDFRAARRAVWGQGNPEVKDAVDVLRNLAQAFASGSHVIVNPFHAGTNFAFLGGQRPGPEGGPFTTSAAIGAPLGEDGSRGRTYELVKRIATFVNHYATLFTDLEPSDQPVTFGVEASEGERARPMVVPLRSPAGGVTFIFAPGATGAMPLLLPSGLEMPVELDETGVGWFVDETDLQGVAWLDYANVCPFGIADRRLAVFFGPAGAPAFLSIDDVPYEGTVPEGDKPTIVERGEIVIVLCNEAQVDSAYFHGNALYVGIDGFHGDGRARAREDAKAWRITSDGAIASFDPHAEVAEDEVAEANGGAASTSKQRSRTATKKKRTGTSRTTQAKLAAWQCAHLEDYITGDSARFASLGGPASLTASGAPTGYGWYRIEMTSATARKQQCVLAQSADRIHLYCNGELLNVLGRGPGAETMPLEMSLVRGQCRLVCLADNLGRFSEGNDLVDRKGVFGHLYAVKPLKSVKPKQVTAPVIDPFLQRGYVLHRARGQHGASEQAMWTFQHLKKSPILLEVRSAPITGTFVLNDKPLEYFAGETGRAPLLVVLDPRELDSFKRGKNELRFAPDLQEHAGLEVIMNAVTVYECIENLSEGAKWSFARWQQPGVTQFEECSAGGAKKLRGVPCWWRTTFMLNAGSNDDRKPCWLDVTGMSKGQAYVNGRNLGRYFTATRDGKAVGPQTRLYLPQPWLRDHEENELVLFDEHGFDPAKVKVTA